MNWDALESPMHPEPLFPVEPPDGRKDWPELSRQTTLFNIMRYAAPKVYGMAIPNAGKRNPRKAMLEGIRGGAFDTVWHCVGLTAYVEMKGYDARGRPGKLIANQIEFGNLLYGFGIPCACFFSPHRAADWLREQGFPVADIREAAA